MENSVSVGSWKEPFPVAKTVLFGALNQNHPVLKKIYSKDVCPESVDSFSGSLLRAAELRNEQIF